MAITYLGTLATDLDKVRFYTGDVTDGSGPRPDGDNFSDNEINGLITVEGNWQRAVAGAFESLAASWANQADLTVGPRSEQYSQIAERYQAQAKEWRDDHGSSISAGAGSRWVTRVDGYSDDIDAGEV